MALSKDELWQIYVDKNPHWLTGGVTMTPDGIKRFFDQTFALGETRGRQQAKGESKLASTIADAFRGYQSR